MKKGASTIVVLSVLSFGLLTGAMLLIGISLVGFWKSLPPSEFVIWFAAHSTRIGNVMIPLGAVTLLLSLAALAVLWRSQSRRWATIAALCALCIMLTYPVFFAAANTSFVAGTLSESAIRQLLDRWAVWHWGRTLLGLAGFWAATLSIQSSAH